VSGYIPPIGNSVAFTFSDDYQAPVGNQVVFDFTLVPVLLGETSLFDGSSINASLLCGTWVYKDGNKIKFDLQDSWASIDGNKISLKWDCPYLVIDCPEMWHDLPGDAIDFDFDLLYIDSIPGDQINFNFTCETNQPSQDIILGSILGYAGDSLTAKIQETFNITFYEGAEYIPNIEFVNIYLPMEFDEGSTLFADLSASPYFTASARGGGAFAADITPSLIAYFTPQFLEGAEADLSDIWTQVSFDVNIGDGADLVGILSTRPSADLEADAFDGASSQSSLTTAVLFNLNPLDGSEASFDLTTIINDGMPCQAFEGSEVDFDLYNVPGFILQALDGSEVDFDLSATYSLTAEADDGSVFVADITPNPNVPFGIQFYEGAIASCDLATTVSFQFESDEGAILSGDVTTRPAQSWSFEFDDGAILSGSLNAGAQNFIFYTYDGASFVADFTPNPSPSMVLQFLDGATASVTISYAANLGNFNFLDGSIANITSLGIDPIIYVYDGAEVSFELATQNTFSFGMYDGGIGSLDIELHPSQGLGLFTAFEGATLEFGALATLISSHLSVVFRNSYVTRADIDSGTDFDLTTDACCGLRDNSGAYVDIGLAEAPDWHYYGYKQIFTVDLSCRPRFAVNFAEGGELTLKDYSAYFNFDFADGSEGKLVAFDQDLKIRLCKGNFIPDGDNIIVELTTVDTEDCEVNFAYEGSTLEAVLANYVQEAPSMYDGAHFDADITVDHPWFFQFWDGAALTMKNFPAELPVNMRDGASASFTFASEGWYAAEGAALTCSGLSTDYDVEFLEVGCLDNEYIPTNENGDPEPELARTTPMEMDPFYHELKARCY